MGYNLVFGLYVSHIFAKSSTLISSLVLQVYANFMGYPEYFEVLKGNMYDDRVRSTCALSRNGDFLFLRGSRVPELLFIPVIEWNKFSHIYYKQEIKILTLNQNVIAKWRVKIRQICDGGFDWRPATQGKGLERVNLEMQHPLQQIIDE